MTDKKNIQSPEFVSLDEAAEMKIGTRVTFVPGVQALYAEALKNICYVKKNTSYPSFTSLHGNR